MLWSRRKPHNYGRVLPTHRWQGLTLRQRVWRVMKPWLALAGLLLLWPLLDAALVEPPAVLSGAPERVTAPFTRCGAGRAENCVVDGDTLRIGQRRIRLIGIDAPELRSPACSAEAAQAEAATEALLALVSQGPFDMAGPLGDPRDKYGRELRVLTRVQRDGTVQSLGADLLASGTVRRYLGGLRGGWC
ncbi:thermonuclease family protein [Novosphingobium sp.]|uniref:thermonuclease family protein n=1 Tax=Novosphingobium sp. TaxID=1874826 RepID=UPI0027365F51|nr:thermonuclease family protein [Novosphingobium sp.]MDP3906696.1 thermonuclease family protein [Novosphingobium sp.]